jgi:hypothetical protein
LSALNLPLKCAVVSLYTVFKQRLKCNTRKVCNYLIQFLLTMFHEKEPIISAQRLFESTVFCLFLVCRKSTAYLDSPYNV